MALFSGYFYFYDSFQKAVGDGDIDLGADTFKVALFTSTFTQDVTDTLFSSLTNELTATNGYTAGGATMTGTTWTQTSGSATFDGGDVQWTATGGSLVARRYVMYSDTATANDLVGVGLIDDNDLDVTTIAGKTLKLTMPTGGIFTGTTNDAT